MAIIIDKRNLDKNPEAGNRDRLIKRCRKGLREAVGAAVDRRSIKDAVKEVGITESSGVLDEPQFLHDPSTGSPTRVFRNNRHYKKGDQISGGGDDEVRGKKAGNEFEDFVFILSKKEVLDILFSEMALPDFVKKALSQETKYVLEKNGTSTEGPMPQLNLLKTMLTAIGRKFAMRKSYKERDPPEKPPFITDEDLRYDVYTETPLPIEKAVMFAIMDVSGSMGDHERVLAKRFFLLLYLFLSKEYKEVDVRFIIHSTEAKEVDEDDFFDAEAQGGTQVTPAFQLVHEIIEQEYDISKVNLYIAQVSDGDDWDPETTLSSYIETNIIQDIQYMAYLQVTPLEETRHSSELGGIYRTYKKHLCSKYKKVNIESAQTLTQIFPVLQNLFKKDLKV